MLSFNESLERTLQNRNSLVCVGLDVDPAKIPGHLKRKQDPLFLFIRKIVDATADYAAAYKPNLAFFEALGSAGYDLLARTVRYIPDGAIVIGDAKRGDIGNTARKYAEAMKQLGFSAVTLNPYLGSDSVEPFLMDPEMGCFVLCLTSNSGSRDFQYLEHNGAPLYMHVARKAKEWNRSGNCGLVVGATHPGELEKIREAARDLPFLIPGIGAQGGDLEASVLAGTDENGGGALINSSRGILYASGGEDFAEAAGNRTQELRDSINRVRKKGMK